MDSAGPRGWLGHAAPGLRPHARRDGPAPAWASTPTACAPRKALWQDAGLEARKTAGTYPFADTQNGSTCCDEPPPHHPQGRPRRVPEGAGIGARGRGSPPPGLTLYPGLETTEGLRLGHGHRPERLHRLQRLRGGLPGGEQHRGGRQGPGAARPRTCTGCAWTPTISGEADQSRDLQPAGALHAVRERAVRAGLPGAGHHATAPKA